MQQTGLLLITAELAAVMLSTQAPTTEASTEPPIGTMLCSHLLIQTLTLDMDLPSLLTVFLTKPPQWTYRMFYSS